MTAEVASAVASRPRFRFGRIALSQELVLFLAIIVLFVVVGAINARFLSEQNLKSIFLGNAYIAVAAIGMSMVIISGNIDISVGSLIGVLATVAGTLAVNGVPIILCWTIPVVLSIALHDHDGRDGRLSPHSLDRGQPRLPVDPEGRADRGDRRANGSATCRPASSSRRCGRSASPWRCGSW